MGMSVSSMTFMTCRLAFCQGKAKGGPVPGLRLDRDGAAVPLDNLLADGQAYAGAGELFPLVQPLEHAENLFEILRVNSQSVVLHREDPFLLAILAGGDVDLGEHRASGT